jgi:hypothetical protein
MTAPERLNARPAAIRPSRCRAPARNAEMRSNPGASPHHAHPKMQNKPTFNRELGTQATPMAAPRPRSPRTGCLALIEIP